MIGDIKHSNLGNHSFVSLDLTSGSGMFMASCTWNSVQSYMSSYQMALRSVVKTN